MDPPESSGCVVLKLRQCGVEKSDFVKFLTVWKAPGQPVSYANASQLE